MATNAPTQLAALNGSRVFALLFGRRAPVINVAHRYVDDHLAELVRVAWALLVSPFCHAEYMARAARLDYPLSGVNQALIKLACHRLRHYQIYGRAYSSEETSAFYSTLALEKVESDGGAIAAGVAGNGVYDSFSALTYVDTAGATNLDTGTAGLLKPALSSGSQAGLDTVTNMNLATQTTGRNGYNIRQAYPASHVTRSGSKIRVLLRGPTSTTLGLSGVTIGHRAESGDAWDTEATPVAITVGGNAAFSLAADVSTWSDWITFNLDETKAIVISFHVATGDNVRIANGTAPTGFVYYTKAAASEIGTANVSGYGTGFDGVVFLVEQIQVASPQDMDVKSSAITLSEAPDWVELFAFVTPNTATLNTDLIFSVTRDATNFQALTMAELYTRLDGMKVYGSGRTTFSAATGTSGKWRIQTDNGKGPEIHAVGLLMGVDA